MLLDDKELEQFADRVAEKLNLRKPPSLVPRLMDIAATAVYMGRSVSGVTHLVKKGCCRSRDSTAKFRLIG